MTVSPIFDCQIGFAFRHLLPVHHQRDLIALPHGHVDDPAPVQHAALAQTREERHRLVPLRDWHGHRCAIVEAARSVRQSQFAF